MQLKKELVQHIAVFGESGSGKTVMISAWYGATQEPQFLKSSLYNVTADLTSQGHKLHANYLGMKDSARPPETNKFAAVPYVFTLKLKDKAAKASGSKPFDAMKLVWHDYPGEWFEADVSEPEEVRRRIDTFQALLSSDVAFLLVDGQKLLDNAGEEERYLKALIGTFRTGLLRLEDDLLADGKLVAFPRIWVLALSKADLLPGLDVYGFRDLVISKAADDLAELTSVIEGLIDAPEALAVGEDFVLFSSAKFEPNRISVAERVGLDLILPMAAMLPFERHVKWVEHKQIGARVAEELLGGADALAAALIGKVKYGGPKGWLIELAWKAGVNRAMATAVALGADQLRKIHTDAMNKRDYLAAVLARFRMDMDDAEVDEVRPALIRSKK